MTLQQIIIRTTSSDIRTPLEMCCTYDDLLEMTGILDNSKQVIEYRILSGGIYYTNNTISFPCEKLVDTFNWGKKYAPCDLYND